MEQALDRDPWADFPFSSRTRDLGWRRLFDLSVAGAGLGVVAGDRVLDLGAGHGYGGEMLARFGVHAVSLDLSAERLRVCVQRKALDRRLGASAPWSVVAGDGCRLPFADGAFHGVLCLHALHHVGDVKGLLAEVARVLVPGGRAAFAEPGIHHRKSYEACLAAERSGERELSVDVERILEIARSHGFSRMEVFPYPYPRHGSLAYEGTGALRKAWAERANPGWALWVVREYRSLFVLQREGERSLDSRWGDGLQARIDVENVPAVLARGKAFEASARIANAGKALWLAAPAGEDGRVRFGVRLLDAEGRVLSEGLARMDLASDVAPGQEVQVRIQVPIPEDAPSRVRLRFDMVSEGVCWFTDALPEGGAVDVPREVRS